MSDIQERLDDIRDRGLQVVQVNPDDPSEQPTIEFEAVA